MIIEFNVNDTLKGYIRETFKDDWKEVDKDMYIDFLTVPEDKVLDKLALMNNSKDTIYYCFNNFSKGITDIEIENKHRDDFSLRQSLFMMLSSVDNIIISDCKTKEKFYSVVGLLRNQTSSYGIMGIIEDIDNGSFGEAVKTFIKLDKRIMIIE